MYTAARHVADTFAFNRDCDGRVVAEQSVGREVRDHLAQLPCSQPGQLQKRAHAQAGV